MNDPEAKDPELEEPEISEPETEESTADAAQAEAPEAESAEQDGAKDASGPEPVIDAPKAKDVEVATTEVVQTNVVPEDVTEPAAQGRGPSILKKVLLWAAIVVAAIFFLVGVAGIIGVWAINTPVTNTILAVLEPIDNTLQRLEAVSGEAAGALADVSTSLNDAEQRVQEMGEGLADTSLVREALNRILDVDLEQEVGKARENARSIYDTVVAVEETINAINAIPFLDIEVPGSEEILSIRTGMEEMAAGAEELRQENQRQREERAENLVAAVTAPIDRLNDRVGEMQTRMTNSETRFGQAVERMDALQGKVPRWVDIASIIATLLLAWLVFSQGAVIALCWQSLHPNRQR